jgi:hypothetical protein
MHRTYHRLDATPPQAVEILRSSATAARDRDDATRSVRPRSPTAAKRARSGWARREGALPVVVDVPVAVASAAASAAERSIE